MLSKSLAAAALATATLARAQNSDGGYWFDNVQDVLATLQATFWNGTYWPASAQWEGAVLSTYLSSSNELFTIGLGEYNGSVPGANTTYASIQANIETYFSQIEAYYGGEDVNEIFGDAYDDVQWVVLEWLEAIKFINLYEQYAQSDLGQDQIANFSHRAHVFYNVVQNEFNTSLCGGGLTWNPALGPYKNAITNELFISSSVGMYLYFPGDNNTDPYPSTTWPGTLPPLPTLAAHDPLLLQNAVKEYDWFTSQAYFNDQGLIVDGFHISDGQTTCDEIDTMVYSYNQGVLLSGLRGLWEATGNTTYLTDGYGYIATVMNATGYQNNGSTLNPDWSGLGQNGIMADYCDSDNSCNGDAQTFKGIYFHHLTLFCQPLPTTTPLVPGVSQTAPAALASSHAQTCASYAPWIEINAQAALNTRNSTDGVIGQWWGAPAAQTQGTAAVAKPVGAVDYRNNPSVLDTPEWKCARGGDCSGPSSDEQHRRLMNRMLAGRRQQKRQSTNQTYSVGTQGQGLSVLIAASNFNLNQPAL